MRLIIATPHATTTYEAVHDITIPTERGTAVIRPGHAEYLTALNIGTVRFISATSEPTTVSLPATGMCYVMEDVVRIVV